MCIVNIFVERKVKCNKIKNLGTKRWKSVTTKKDEEAKFCEKVVHS